MLDEITLMNKTMRCTCCGKNDEPLYYINVGIRWFNNTDNIHQDMWGHCDFALCKNHFDEFNKKYHGQEKIKIHVEKHLLLKYLQYRLKESKKRKRKSVFTWGEIDDWSYYNGKFDAYEDLFKKVGSLLYETTSKRKLKRIMKDVS